MKPKVTSVGLSKIVFLALFLILISSSSSYAVNVISGFIFDKAGVAVQDIDIELQDEYKRTVPNGRQKTNSSGRYEFQVNNSGRYFLKVYAFQLDLLDDEREVNIASVTSTSISGGSSYNNEDFYLQPKKGGLREAELSVIFAQDIPKDAKAAFDQSVKLLAKKQTAEGYEQLRKSIEIFPKYFNALYRFGLELMAKKQYLDAGLLFMRAAAVNEKSAMSYFNMAHCLDSVGPEYRKAAFVAINEALKLAPASAGANLVAGRIARELGNFAAAEKSLIQAKKLSNKSDAQIHWELAKLYSENLKKYKEAADELESFIKASKISGEEETKMKGIVAGFRDKAKNQATN